VILSTIQAVRSSLANINEAGGQPFIAMELLEGETLARRIEERRLTAEEILRLAAQVADGLAAAHAERIFHRDIKPGNIFVTRRGDAKVLGFGLARQLREDARGLEATGATLPPAVVAGPSLTGHGAVLGTVAYMSPEQALGLELDARTDLFSLGVVLHEMSTGVRPLQGDTPAALFDDILHKVPDTRAHLAAGVPPDLRTRAISAAAPPRPMRSGRRSRKGESNVAQPKPVSEAGRHPIERRRFGCSNRHVPAIGQGTWCIDDAERRSAVAALRRGLDLGMTHIDTAEMYGGAEAIVAEAIAGRREEVFLVSKVLPQHASRTGTVEACERSLSRLQTDHLDSYLLHWRGQHPLEETVAAFEQLQRDGKIRSWGVSNFDVRDLEDVFAIAGENRLTCNQVLYHLGERYIEHEVIPWCEGRGVAVVAYSPFGHGRFPGPQTPGGRVLQEIAGAHGATPRQVALRFLVQWPSLFTIPKASSPEHAAENAGAGRLELTAGDIERIDEAFPRGRRRRDLPVL
jgi:diketogulonate reductase-like aldo/keto reductase